jgi:sulfocyanin
MSAHSVVLAAGLLLFTTQLAAQTPQGGAQVDCNQLAVDTVTKTATFQLVSGQTNQSGGLNFNGFIDGKLTLTVPQNWNVVIQFTNKDPNLPHSAEIIDTTKPMPAGPVDPTFPGALTTKQMTGLASGESDTFRFVANKPGSFLIFCAVPGHGLAGMWIRLKVSPTDKRPTLVATTS